MLAVRCGHGELQIIRYLEEPPSRARLVEVIGLLGDDARVLLRAEDGPPELASASQDDIIDALATSAFLIQRPVVINARGARIGRPPERVLEIL